MTSEVDLEVNMEVLPAEPRRPRGELFLSQLSVADTIQACRWTHKHTPGVCTVDCDFSANFLMLHLHNAVHIGSYIFF